MTVVLLRNRELVFVTSKSAAPAQFLAGIGAQLMFVELDQYGGRSDSEHFWHQEMLERLEAGQGLKMHCTKFLIYASSV